MEEILKMQNTINQIIDTTNTMNYEFFICTMCMLFDEYARSNDKNAPELSETVNTLVTQVNAELGAY